MEAKELKTDWILVIVCSVVAISFSWFNVILLTCIVDIIARSYGNPYTGLQIKDTTGQTGLILGLFGFLLAPLSLFCLFYARRHLMASKLSWTKYLYFVILMVFTFIPLNYFIKNIDFDMTRPKNKAVWDEVTQKYKITPLNPGETE